MKLYDFALAPSPRRVRMFLAEKGVEVPSVQVNIREREQFGDVFRAINPYSQVPALELDDGTIITESAAICRYFEEIHPEPPLMGRDAVNRAIVEMWNRRVEFHGYLAVVEAVRNSLPMFEDRALPGVPGGAPQILALAERGKATFNRFLMRIDERLRDTAYLAGGDFTIADITAFVTIEFAGRIELGISEGYPNVAHWHGQIAARPSAEA
ncbi:MAG: glutathione S-transferase family protein [Nitrospiraceae bacterium]